MSLVAKVTVLLPIVLLISCCLVCIIFMPPTVPKKLQLLFITNFILPARTHFVQILKIAKKFAIETV
jgi:hypothetical protein